MSIAPVLIGLGPIMMDLAGPELDPVERELLLHPAIGGVVLFTRNYEDREQLKRLTSEIHPLRVPPLVIAVDHEGGRVQRFRDGFTELPAAGAIGDRYERAPGEARALAKDAGFVAATELRLAGVDLDFAPVLDLAAGNEEIIGDRAFSADPAVVADLARCRLEGARRAGFSGVGKHFPGHGTARGDTHTGEVVDERPFEALRATDLKPFAALAPELSGMMTGHVCYPAVAPEAVTFSSRWLRDVLRDELGFNGVILSDDLSMAAVTGAQAYADEGSTGPEERVALAFEAGCDVALVLNDRAGLERVLDAWPREDVPPGALSPEVLLPLPIPEGSLTEEDCRHARERLQAFMDASA